jgi:enolase
MTHHGISRVALLAGYRSEDIRRYFGDGSESGVAMTYSIDQRGVKGSLNAVANVTEVIAPQFLGKRISELGTLADIDRELLLLELDLATKRGKISATASPDEKVQIMQRKANLGMNAILSLSLALGRLIAARDGRELPDVLREAEQTLDRDYLYGIKARVEVPEEVHAS